jgi:hypothetical protein
MARYGCPAGSIEITLLDVKYFLAIGRSCTAIERRVR